MIPGTWKVLSKYWLNVLRLCLCGAGTGTKDRSLRPGSPEGWEGGAWTKVETTAHLLGQVSGWGSLRPLFSLPATGLPQLQGFRSTPCP